MTEDEIRDKLVPYNLKRLSDETGLPYVTLTRFAAGKTARPSWKLVKTLENYLEGR